MKLGKFEIYPVLDGFLRIDGGTMFGRAPKEIWKKNNRADKKNRILLALRCLLIKTKNHNILIDTGVGNKLKEKLSLRFAIDRKIDLKKSLALHGLEPKDIDIVINTHLHFDHCGGNTEIENGKIVPAFPQAKYLIQKGEWLHAFSGNSLDKASYLEENFLPLKDYGLVNFIEGDVNEIEPGITLIKTGGHTEDHQIVKIEDDGKVVFYLADLVPTASHLNYPYIMAFDLEPLETLRKKMELLPKIAKNHSLIIFEHEPKFSAGFIEIKNTKIQISKAFLNL